MTLPQGLSFALVGVTVICFLWGRWRYDLVAVGALVVGVAIGVVPVKAAFEGFSNDIVIIIASALVVSAAIARSGVVEMILRPVLPRLITEGRQVTVLAGATALLSMITKNVGALAILMPTAVQLSRRTGTSQARLLMPMSFGSLVGGLAILVGTSPNIIVAGVRKEALGKPFGMFDFMPVGLGLTAVTLVYLAFAYRMLPKSRQPAVGIEAALAGAAYVTEAEVPEDWAKAGTRVRDLNKMSNNEVSILALIRKGQRLASPHPNVGLRTGDLLMLEGEEADLNALIGRAALKLTRADRAAPTEEAAEDVRVIEAVVGQDSPLIGESAQRVGLHEQHGVNLLGVSRAGYRMTQKLKTVRLRAGDILVLQGGERTLPGALKDLGCLPLAERPVQLGGVGRTLKPAMILVAAMALVAFGLVPVPVAFFGAAVLMVAISALRMREAYAALDAPVLVLIAALIPVADAVQSTGGTDLIARGLSVVFHGLPPLVTLVAVMAVAMAATPFLNNAATVLIVAPIGMSLAQRLGLSPDPFLMAVAVGAGCDFLTPIGHQCNTLIMGPGGYRFLDYPRLGGPLSLIILAVGPLLISVFWPL